MSHHPPLRGSREAPTFDGAALHLNRFFADVDLVLYATGTVYSDAERIRKCKYYVDHSTAELWDYVVAPTWGAFKENIRAFYPGSEDSGVYRRADLERIVLEKSREEIKTLAEYGNYLREFTTVATDLCTHGRLGELDRERMFLNGFSGEVRERILFRLQVLDPSHHPDDPYPSVSVQRAIEWVLSASRASPTVPAPAPPTIVITPPRTIYPVYASEALIIPAHPELIRTVSGTVPVSEEPRIPIPQERIALEQRSVIYPKPPSSPSPRIASHTVQPPVALIRDTASARGNGLSTRKDEYLECTTHVEEEEESDPEEENEDDEVSEPEDQYPSAILPYQDEEIEHGEMLFEVYAGESIEDEQTGLEPVPSDRYPRTESIDREDRIVAEDSEERGAAAPAIREERRVLGQEERPGVGPTEPACVDRIANEEEDPDPEAPDYADQHVWDPG